MSVPFLTLQRQTAALRTEIEAALAAVIDEQCFAGGPEVERFEQELGGWLDPRAELEVVGVNNGTTALHAALLAVGVGPGDEVITTPLTWISTAWAISYVGAIPVFADVDPLTANLDPEKISNVFSERTRAILTVHLYGNPSDLDRLSEVSDLLGVPLIEDCAQSIGATWRGKQTGTFGSVNATSFYPGKNLGAWGEAGAVLTKAHIKAGRVRRLRDHAQASRHEHLELGFNWRMDGLQAAVLRVKLRHLAAGNERRREVAAQYHEAFADLSDLTLLSPQAAAAPIWHVYPVFHSRRDALRDSLQRRGVTTAVHYPVPVHRQPAYAFLGKDQGAFPVAERLAATELSLPMFPELGDGEVQQVIEAVRASLAEVRQQ